MASQIVVVVIQDLLSWQECGNLDGAKGHPMNRRRFLTAIPAVVAAVASLKGAGATQGANTSSVSIERREHGLNAYLVAGGPSPGANGSVMQPGAHYCQHCHADFFPAGPRLSEGHVAARFGRDDRRHFDVFEGDTKLLQCYEAYAGRNGWVIEGVNTHGPILTCPACRKSVLCHLRYADVTVVRQWPTS